MAVSRVLDRLLRIRKLEEEQCQAALELALAQLHQLERTLAGTAEHDRQGRRMVAEGAQAGEAWKRFAGLLQSHSAGKSALRLVAQIASAADEVETLRSRFLAKRVERRQAETLVEEARARHAVEVSRRAQQGTDDWYLNRRSGKREQADAPASASSRDSEEAPQPARGVPTHSTPRPKMPIL